MRKRSPVRSAKKVGVPPGTLVYVGDQPSTGHRLSLFGYNEQQCTEKTFGKVEDCIPAMAQDGITWINVDGVNNPGLLESFGKALNLHPLTLEDILNTEQRPKLEDYGNYLYIVVKMLEVDPKTQALGIEQLSLVLGPNYIISFQERPGDMFDPVRDRIRKSAGKLRKLGADYLCYALIDAVVDHYFVVLEKVADRIEALEAELIPSPKRDSAQRIHDLKRELIFLRRAIWPLREVAASLQRTESELIRQGTGVYLRDVHDHVVQATDGIDTFRDMLSGMLDMYHSSIGNRTNEIIKVLTLFTSVFMPLGFITGIFGMNFKDFPLLEWHWGFAGVMVVMVLIWIAMMVFFRRKGWL